MTTCNIDHSADYRNNGLITKIWGEAGWTFGHAITYGYPIEPTNEQKKEYKQYFISLGNVLPCRYCRESYKIFITEGETALTDEVLTNRRTLTKWFHGIHEAVNRKLDVDYGVSIKDIDEKYESFRARCGKSISTDKGCVAPLDYKAFSFKKLYYKDCPIIPLEIVKPFIKLARARSLDPIYFSYLDLVYELGGDFSRLKKQPSWEYRNKFCQQQIRYMRENAIPSVELEGPWTGTPTMDELKLLMFLSANLNRGELRGAQARL